MKQQFDAKAFMRGCMKSHPITEPDSQGISQPGEAVAETEINFKQRVRILLSEGVRADQMGIVSAPGVTWGLVYLVYTHPQSDQMERPTIAIITDCERRLYHRRFEKWLSEELTRLGKAHH